MVNDLAQVFFILIAENVHLPNVELATQSSPLETVRWVANREFSSAQILLRWTEKQVVRLTSGKSTLVPANTHTHTHRTIWRIPKAKAENQFTPACLCTTKLVLGTCAMSLSLQIHPGHLLDVKKHAFIVMNNAVSYYQNRLFLWVVDSHISHSKD